MPRHISTTALSKKLRVTSRELFAEFEKLEWITADRNLTVDGFSIGGIYKEIKKDGETIKYIAWPDDIKLGVTPQDSKFLTATSLARDFSLSAIQINYILAEIGWTKKGELNKGWNATKNGLEVGAIQAEDTKTGFPYVRWPASIAKNPILVKSIDEFKGSKKTRISNPDINAFRERFPLKFQATDGHLTRSKAESLIDNWLYLFEITHAYERRLPIEEEAFASFYIPQGKVYIEYFGCDAEDGFGYDKNCNRRRDEKLEIYAKHNLNLIELKHSDILNLDEVLPKLLLKHGVQTY